ncbi:Oligopeptide-binding protein AppA [bacterium HR40]|nr:Oligopeptide-binding protein AppA [bacterium HR40]
MRPQLYRLCALVAMLLPLAATAAKPRTLIIGITQYPATLHPLIDSMAAKSYVLGATLRPLTAYDAAWQRTCLLCVELPTFENGLAVREILPDGRTGVAVTYEIRPGARWGDGVPVSTDDVIFAWEVGRHPLSGVASAESFRRIHAIERLDDRRFVVHSDRLTYQYNLIAPDPLPAHLERPVFEADPATYRNRTLYDTDPTHPGLWYGPYRVVEVATGSHIVLERNPTFFGDPPFFDRVVIRAIENTAALEANLLSGNLDMIEGALGMSLDQAIAFEKRAGDRFRVHYQPGLVYEHIDLMLDNPMLSDVRVRQALLYALDRETLVRQLFAGRQPVAHGPVHPNDPMYDPEVPTYPFDPTKAAALFAEAGYRRGPDGVLVDASGRRLRLELMTTAGNRSRELVQQVLQGMWRRAGVEVTIRNEPARVFFGETVSRRAFTGLALFAWISAPESVPRSTLHSGEIPRPDNGWSGQNYTGYRNPRMDALLDAIENELDPERRRGLWAELQRLYAHDLPALPLYFRAEPHVWPIWLEGPQPTGHLAPTTFGIEHWRRVSD